MTKKMLDREIDDTLAEYVLQKVQEHKEALQADYASALDGAKATYEAKLEKSFSFIDQKIAEERAAIREEYSAKLVEAIEGKNAEIADLQDDYERMKEELAENVQTFLSNSKDELRGLVAEEMRLDSEELKAQKILEQIKDLVGQSVAPVPVEDHSGEISRLKEEAEALKARVEKDREVKETLKADLRKSELAESVPSSDRDFYLAEMAGVSTVAEVDATFERVQKAVKKHNARKLEEELEESRGKGVDSVEEETFDYIEESVEETHQSFITARMKELAQA